MGTGGCGGTIRSNPDRAAQTCPRGSGKRAADPVSPASLISDRCRLRRGFLPADELSDDLRPARDADVAIPRESSNLWYPVARDRYVRAELFTGGLITRFGAQRVVMAFDCC